MKTKLSLLLVILGLFCLFIVNALAAPLSDPDDIFFIDRPRPNSQLSEVSELRFKIYDDENDKPPYEIALYQSDCVTKFGTIVSNNYVIEDSNNVYTKEWNTDGPIKDRATVPNGKYCLKACVTLKKNGVNYSVCDSRPVTLVDPVNKPPTITSTPPNTLILIGQAFGYDVEATDPDGDVLTYQLVNPPNFLQINPQTGQISSKVNLTISGSYSVVVKVSDGKGGEVMQEFNLVVEERPTSVVKKIEIVAPAEKDILHGQDNLVKYSLENIISIKQITLFYSTDAATWTEIGKLSSEADEYIWDVTSLEGGDYYLKIEVVTEDNKKYEAISKQFSIKSEEDSVESAASIINLNPGEDVQIKELTEIRATLVSSEGAEIDVESLEVKLNEESITNLCTLQNDQVICDLTTITVEEGRHKVSIAFEDTAGKQTQKEWYFEVVIQGEEDSQPVEAKETLSTIALAGLICSIILLLLLIPWILYLIWKRRNIRAEKSVAEQREQGPVLSPDTDLSPTYYYPEAETLEVGPRIDQDLLQEEDLDIGESTIGQQESIAEPAQTKRTQVQVMPEQAPEVLLPKIPQEVVQEPVQSVDPQLPTQDLESTAQPPIEIPMPSIQQSQAEQLPQQQAIASPVIADQTDAQEEPQIDVGPDNQFTEDDIPDWLKGESGGSTPMVPGGAPVQLPEEQKDDELKGANPYGDYGLAQKDDQDN